MTADDDDLQHVLDLERKLQTLAVRANVDRLRELLAPNFIEVGASGTRWDRDAILDLLSQENAASKPQRSRSETCTGDGCATT